MREAKKVLARYKITELYHGTKLHIAWKFGRYGLNRGLPENLKKAFDEKLWSSSSHHSDNF